VWPWTTSVLRRLTFKPLAAFSKSASLLDHGATRTEGEGSLDSRTDDRR